MLTGKRVTVMGGTGSLGNALVRRLLFEELGKPSKVTVFSRDEAKQHEMRLAYQHDRESTNQVVRHNARHLLQFVIGDVRDRDSVSRVMHDTDVVLLAASLKQVPICEYFPFEAVQTNVIGAQNVVQVIRDFRLPVETVVGISTDKACKPVSVMGMTKALQERILLQANLDCPQTRFVCVRYGNVLGSRGSVVPLFCEQILRGGPVTVTSADMTRFLLTLDQAVDTVAAALRAARPGDIFTPGVPSALVVDIAAALIGDRSIAMELTGIRPGEKVHEIMISQEEAGRTRREGGYNVIMPGLPELRPEASDQEHLDQEYTSADCLMSKTEVRELFRRSGLLP